METIKLLKKETGKNKITVPIPVYGRLPLVDLTVSRLLDQNVIPIIIGTEADCKDIANKHNIEWIKHDNKPLGKKWNSGFIASRDYKPDHIIFLGSSDWVSKDYLNFIKSYDQDFGLIGMLGNHYVDVSSNSLQLMRWKGYTDKQRTGEPIGIGRVLSKSFLDTINWKPFEDNIDNGLDWSMWTKALNTNQKIKIIEDDSGVNLLSISTDKWVNKHKFNHFFNGVMAGIKEDPKILDKDFVEIHELKKRII